MRKRSRRRDGRTHERAMQRDEMVWNQRRDFAVGQAMRPSVPMFGLWLVSASLVSGLLWQVIWIVDVNRLVQSEDVTSEDIDDLLGRAQGSLHLAHLLGDARGLAIPVQRRRCRDCRQLNCGCVIWRIVREGRHA